jgi:methionine-rich copper-binding protein CopC
MSRRQVVALLLAPLVRPAAVAAHAVLVRSSPARRAALTHPPTRVELWFSERLEPAYSVVSVTNAAGDRVDQGDVTVGPDDLRRLSVSLTTLRPGRYAVWFRVLSVDSHVVEASFTFTVERRR